VFTSKFNTGDQVELTAHYDRLLPGTKGTVKGRQPASDRLVPVQFPGFKGGHNLGGLIPDGDLMDEGYFVPAGLLKVVNIAFRVGDKVTLMADHDAATKGLKGTVVFIKDDPSYQPYGVRFNGWKGGHELNVLTGSFRLEGKHVHQGHWVPGYKLVLTPKVNKEPKVDDKVVITKEWDSAKPGMLGTIVVPLDKSPSGTSYGLRIPALGTMGHSLDGALLFPDRTIGQWVPATHFKRQKRNYVRKPKAVVVPVPAKTDPLADLPRGKSVTVKLRAKTTTQDAAKSINPGTYYGQAFLVSGRRTILVSFGAGEVLIFESSDPRIEVLSAA
jgi:hypothetical protein